MLGFGWLAKQFGRLGGAMKGGLQQMQQQGGQGQYRTPGFNPNTTDDGFLNRRPVPRSGEPPALMEMGARGEPGRLPAPALDIKPPVKMWHPPMPGSPETPAAPSGWHPPMAMPSESAGQSAGRPTLAPMTGSNAATIAAPEMRPRELPGARVEDVPIPSVPGIPGGPQPYDPIAKERFDYIYSRMPKDENGMERKHTFGERMKAGLLPMLAGAARGAQASPNNPLWGAIGGAGTGFGVGAINPNAGSQISFNTFTEPRLLADQARREDDYRRGVQREREGLSVEKDRADIEYRRAQTDATRGGMKDAALEREYRRSQIDANNALAEARRTGKPQIRNVVDSDGASRSYAFYPDGRQEYLGDSEKAMLATEANQSRERIATGRNETAVKTTEMRQTGANSRTAMTQAGQDRRAAAKAGGGDGGPAPAGKRKAFIDRAVGAGYSRAEAEAEANRRGLK